MSQPLWMATPSMCYLAKLQLQSACSLTAGTELAFPPSHRHKLQLMLLLANPFPTQEVSELLSSIPQLRSLHLAELHEVDSGYHMAACNAWDILLLSLPFLVSGLRQLHINNCFWHHTDLFSHLSQLTGLTGALHPCSRVQDSFYMQCGQASSSIGRCFYVRT